MIRFLFKFTLFAGALTLGGLIASAVFRETVEGSGTAATEDRAIGEVTEVELAGTGNLVITVGEVPSLTVTADDNILPLIETETTGRKLTLSIHSGYTIRTKTPITYTLTVAKLTKLSVSGSGSAKVANLTGDTLSVRVSGSGKANLNGIECHTLNLNLSGSGTAVVSGTAEKVISRVSGSGEIDAGSLKAKAGEVQVSGSGNVSVWTTDQLKLRVSGSGQVTYKGTPQLEQKITGSGRVKPIRQ